MAYKNGDWYQHLVDQSRTDHIYDLIHGNLPHNWAPGHHLDFVVIRRGTLPEKLNGNIPESHISKALAYNEYCFPGDDFVLLDNDHLTIYIEAAKEMKVIDDFSDRQFIELVFKIAENGAKGATKDKWRDYILEYESKRPEKLDEGELSLIMAYELLKSGSNKEHALVLAIKGEKYLSTKKIALSGNIDFSINEIWHIATGYNIVAMVYAWNNQIDRAAAIDNFYIKYPNLWEIMDEHIASYLKMLMAKKQIEYLTFLFADTGFRAYFLPHYEAFVSLFINDRYELTCMREVVTIINTVNNFPTHYL